MLLYGLDAERYSFIAAWRADSAVATAARAAAGITTWKTASPKAQGAVARAVFAEWVPENAPEIMQAVNGVDW